MTERTVSEIRQEFIDRLCAVEGGLTSSEMIAQTGLEGWLVDAILERMVRDGDIGTDRAQGGPLRYVLLQGVSA